MTREGSGPTGEQTGERELIEAAQQDPSRFAELYELCFDRVYAYVVSRVRDRFEAQDVTSEVFQHAFVNLQRFEWRGVPFIAWLFRIAANALADRTAREAREFSIIRRKERIEEIDGAVSPEEIHHRAQIFALVRELPPDQRRVVELRFVEQKSIREIAADLDRSEGAVKQLQFRGLETLRARLGGSDG